jgi:hypothetical protein
MILDDLHGFLFIVFLRNGLHFIEIYSEQTLKFCVSRLVFDFTISRYVVKIIDGLNLFLRIFLFHEMLCIINHLLDEYYDVAWHFFSIDFHLLCSPRKADYALRHNMFIQLDSVEILIKFL